LNFGASGKITNVTQQPTFPKPEDIEVLSTSASTSADDVTGDDCYYLDLKKNDIGMNFPFLKEDLTNTQKAKNNRPTVCPTNSNALPTLQMLPKADVQPKQ